MFIIAMPITSLVVLLRRKKLINRKTKLCYTAFILTLCKRCYTFKPSENPILNIYIIEHCNPYSLWCDVVSITEQQHAPVDDKQEHGGASVRCHAHCDVRFG